LGKWVVLVWFGLVWFGVVFKGRLDNLESASNFLFSLIRASSLDLLPF
jgi:hypothetical protein